MNKKLLFGVFAAASMLFATSCQKDELNSVQEIDEATISFTLGVESGVQTRAISDGSSADRLVYAVFNENGERITSIAKVDKTTTFPATETITLAKGQTYKVAFWAQNSATNAYAIDDSMTVTIDYNRDSTNNNESRDAFFKTETFTVTGNTNINVELERPFAQINVGVYTGDDNKNGTIEDNEVNKDWEYALASGVNIETSKVVIKNVATKLDLVSGNVDGKTDVTYDFGTIPAKSATEEWLEVDTDSDGIKEHFKYLSMSYFLVNPNGDNGQIVDGGAKTNLEGVEFTFHSNEGEDIVLSEGLTQVPVKRNWRTNIIGQLLTGNISFTIKVDPIYDGEYNNETPHPVLLNNVYYENIEQAIATIATDAADVVTEISLGEGSFVLPATAREKNWKFVGAGDPANTVIECKAEGNNSLANSEVTFENLTIETDNASYRGFIHISEAIFKNCIFNSQFTLYNDGAEPLKFENCTFNITGDMYSIWTWGASAVFTDCIFNCDGKAVLVYGGDSESTVTFNNCTFNDNGGINGKAAIEVGYGYAGCKYNVYINDCTVNGFDVTSPKQDRGGDDIGTNIWGNKDRMTREELNIFINNTEVY